MKAKKILKVILGISTCGMSILAEKVIKSAHRGNKVAQAGCAVVAGIMLIGIGGAMAEKGEGPVTVVEDQNQDVSREAIAKSNCKDQEKVLCRLYDQRGNRVKSIWQNFRKRDNIDNNIEGIIKKLTIMDY